MTRTCCGGPAGRAQRYAQAGPPGRGLPDTTQGMTACLYSKLGRAVLRKGTQQELGMVLHRIHRVQAAVHAGTEITTVHASLTPVRTTSDLHHDAASACLCKIVNPP